MDGPRFANFPFKSGEVIFSKLEIRAVPQSLLTLKQESKYFGNYLGEETDEYWRWDSSLHRNRLSSPAFAVPRQPCGAVASPRVMLRQQEWTPWAQSSLRFTFSQLKVDGGSWMLPSAMSVCSRINLFHTVTGLPTVLFV